MVVYIRNLTLCTLDAVEDVLGWNSDFEVVKEA